MKHDTGGLKLDELRECHQILDDEIDEANGKRWLTPRERLRIKTLKVRRLRLRDRISILERECGD